MPSLLDFSSMVSLMQQDHFNRYFRLQLGPAEGSVADTHHLFDLTSASGGAIPLSRYVELDVEFLGLHVPRVRFLITQNPNKVLDPDHRTRLPRIVGWNLVKLAYQEFLKKYNIDVFEDFKYPDGVNPLLFSQLSIYYYADVVPAVVNEICDEDGLVYTEEVTKNKKGNIIDKKKQNFVSGEDKPAGTVTIGMNNQPICVPGNSTITVPGKLSELVKKGSYLVESAAHNNLPSGLVVNHSYATSKAGQVAVILINTTSRNIWICQPLFAAEIFEVELHPWQYKSILHREGNTIKVGFQPVVPPEVEGDLQTNQVEVEVKEEPSEEESTPPLPSFGPRPDTTQDYDFKDEVEKLPFKFNLGDAPFSKEQTDHLLSFIYDHEKVFSLHNEDLGFCTKLAHSISTTTEKPVYLPHRTIPRQLQGEVRKCLDTWLRQGIIRPSKSLYASQVVILRKKTGEIQLCVNYQKLNSIMVRDAFSLPRIDVALQAVHNCQWFMSFDLP